MRGRKEIILNEDVIKLILDYREMGLSYSNIKRALKERHEIEISVYKVQQIIKKYF